ncbi:MAG TPA: hypothetical protein VIK52_02695 [Opitutaceae bacterium]
MATLTFRAREDVSRKIRAAAKRRGVPVSRFIKEAAEREAARDADYEPNEVTAMAINEPAGALTRYRTVSDAFESLKSDAKRRPKRSVSA